MLFKRGVVLIQSSGDTNFTSFFNRAIEKKDKCVKFILRGNKSYFYSATSYHVKKVSSVTNRIYKTFSKEMSFNEIIWSFP